MLVLHNSMLLKEHGKTAMSMTAYSLLPSPQSPGREVPRTFSGGTRLPQL